MRPLKKKHKKMFFHGRRMTPNPTSSALRGYNYKQPLCACGVAGLIKNNFLCFFYTLRSTHNPCNFLRKQFRI